MAVGDGVTWNEGLPDNDTVANEIDDYDRDLRVGVRSRMAREHVWGSSQTATNEAGHHRFITFQAQTSAPTIAGTTAGCLYVGASSAGYPLIFENSASTSITLINSAGLIPVVSGGTQGAIVICSSASPTSLVVLSPGSSGSVLYSQGSTGAPAWAGLLGAWVDKSSSYGAQQATTDGFVVVYITRGASAGQGYALCYTDSNSDPTTIRTACGVEYSGDANSSVQYNGTMMPVKKGDYWKVVQSGVTTIAVYWIPIGA